MTDGPDVPDRPAVFLDRDGTLNREVDYLSDPADLELLPGVATSLKRLADAGYVLCVVTNQSGVARGYFEESKLAEIHARLRELLEAEGVHLDWIGYCPYHESEGLPAYRADSACRKPRPGMFIEAAATLGLSFERSWCIGDSLRDVDAGARLGVQGLLVRTGKGADEEARALRAGRRVEVVDDLEAAADRILVV